MRALFSEKFLDLLNCSQLINEFSDFSEKVGEVGKVNKENIDGIIDSIEKYEIKEIFAGRKVASIEDKIYEI